MTILRLAEVDSTQDEARRRIQSGDDSFDAIAADRQTSGRGRLGRQWVSAPQCLALTVVWRKATAAEWPPGIALAAGIAVAEALDCLIAWPNDLLADGRKVGGILCELNPGLPPLVGIGVNRAPVTEFPDAGWLDLAGDLAEVVAAAVLGSAPPREFAEIEVRWRAKDATPGKPYRLPDGRMAVADRVMPDGALSARVADEVVVVPSAEAIYGSGS